jgi:hypothetical protein
MSVPLTLAGRTVLMAHHVDGLELSCVVERIPPALAGRPDELECSLDLDQRRALATVPPWPVPCRFTWEGEPVIAHPSGKRPGRRYCLQSDDWMLFVSGDRAPGPRFVVQLRSDYLLRVGPVRASEAVREWVAEHLLSLLDLVPDTEPRWGIARLDLAADITGLSLAPEDIARFTTRARARRTFHTDPDGAGEPVSTHYVGRELTGYTFGKRGGACHARVYDKNREAAADAPIREVWNTAGYDPARDGEQVWRVEFEVRSELLRILAAGGDHLPSDPSEILAHHLDELWAHLTSEWLVFHASSATRIERSPVAAWWDALSAARGLDGEQFGPVRPLVRRAREQHDTTVLLKQAVGLLASAAAASGSNASLEHALEAFATYARDAEGETAFARRVRRRRRRYQSSLPLRTVGEST